MNAPDISPQGDRPTASDLQRAFLRNLTYTLVNAKYSATPADLYVALAHSVRDILADRWLETQQNYYRTIAEYTREIRDIQPEIIHGSRHFHI